MWRFIGLLTTVLLINGCGSGTGGSSSSTIPNLAEGNSDTQSTDTGVDAAEQLQTPFTATLIPNENGTITIYSISLQLSQPLDFANTNLYSFTLLDENNEKVGNFIHYKSDTNRIVIEPEILDYDAKYRLELNSTLYSVSGQELQFESALELTTDSDNRAPRAISSYPTNDELVLRTTDIRIEYDEAINIDSINQELIVLQDKKTGVQFDFVLEMENDNHTLAVIPVGGFDYDARVELILPAGIADISGNGSTNEFALRFDTWGDYGGPQFVSSLPATDASNVNINSAITVTFDRDLDASAIDNNAKYLNLQNGTPLGIFVPYSTSVDGNTLTITPDEPLKYDSVYEIGFYKTSHSTIRDLNGNGGYEISNWTFHTELYQDRIALPVNVDAFDLHRDTNTLYTLDAAAKQLTSFNLDTDSTGTTLSLEHTPNEICIHAESDRFFITNSSADIINEYRLSDLEKLTDIPWSGGSIYGNSTTDRRFECTSEHLFISSFGFSPKLHRIDRALPHTEQILSGIDGVGDFEVASNGNIYTWFLHQGLAGTKVSRYANNGGSWQVASQSTKNFPDHRAEPWDSPILLDEANSRLLNKRYVFDTDNLAQPIHDFGNDVVMYAADFQNNKVAGIDSIYSLTDFSKIGTIPASIEDGMVFDKDGELYIIHNDTAFIYVVR